MNRILRRICSLDEIRRPNSEIYDAKTGQLLESLVFDTSAAVSGGDYTHGQWSPRHQAIFSQRWSFEGDLYLVELGTGE